MHTRSDAAARPARSVGRGLTRAHDARVCMDYIETSGGRVEGRVRGRSVACVTS